MQESKFLWNFGRAVTSPIVKIGYRYHTKRIHIEPPFVLICNHSSNFDPLFISQTIDIPIHYLSTDTISNIPIFGKMIQKMFSPIPVDKADIDVNAIRALRDYVKENKAVGFFPEGNRSYDGSMIGFKESTAKLIRNLGVPIVCFNIRGGYFKSPRWGSKIRGGFVTGEVKRIIPPEEIKDMPVKDLYELLKDSISVDAYESQRLEYREFPSKHNAEYIQALLYMCPNCLSEQTVYGKNNYIYCSKCGKKQLLDNYGLLHNCAFETVQEWSKWQNERAMQKDYSGWDYKTAIFNDSHYALKVKQPDETRIRKRGNGTISLFRDRFEFAHRRGQVTVIPLDKIANLTAHGRSNIHIKTADGVSIKLRTVNNKANGLKYVIAYHNLIAHSRLETSDE